MAGVPVAAARSKRAGGDAPLQARLRAFLGDSPRGGANRLAERLLPAPPSGVPAEESFYWLRMANWLAESFDLSITTAERSLYEDLCWAQYCVYSVFRVQDDLIDGEVDEPLLAVETNRLLVEGARCAARHFEGSSPFWEVFQDTIASTTSAIVALDGLQRDREREPHTELDHFVDLAAALKIAAAGVAIAAGRVEAWRERISPAMDGLAVAGQILDDLEDIEDDLADGRINYAAWFLSRPVVGATPDATMAVVASNIATTDRLGSLFEVARDLVAGARRILGPALCPAMYSFLLRYREGIDTLERELSAKRRALFEAGRAAA